jgi:hypothetical protein
MKDEKEIQTAWELLDLIEKLDQLLWDRYGDDFLDINPYEQHDPCLGPLGPLGPLDSQDKTGG